MWEKGKVDEEGYFTLTNSYSKKVMTSISEDRLETTGTYFITNLSNFFVLSLLHLCIFLVFTLSTDPLKLTKVQKEFFMGHGIRTDDPKAAAKILLKRDHMKLLELLIEYYHGKLGMYMIPCMFFGQVPEAISLSNYEKALTWSAENVTGDIAERKVYYALKKYFTLTGDDVLIIHSHKFLQKDTVNEKDFILLNLSKGK